MNSSQKILLIFISSILLQAGGIFAIIGALICVTIPILATSLVIRHYLVIHLATLKQSKTILLIDEISKHNVVWNYSFLKDRTQKCFYKTLKAWKNTNIDIAKKHISQNLYNEWQTFGNCMFHEIRNNITRTIKLEDIKIIAIHDFQDNKNDAFWACIKGKIINPKTLEPTGPLLQGPKKERSLFIELWHFSRNDFGWVLNEIKRDITIANINAMHSFSE